MTPEQQRNKDKCDTCILNKGCTRTTINIIDGYCWADHIIDDGEPITKEEFARRRGLL